MDEPPADTGIKGKICVRTGFGPACHGHSLPAARPVGVQHATFFNCIRNVNLRGNLGGLPCSKTNIANFCRAWQPGMKNRAHGRCRAYSCEVLQTCPFPFRHVCLYSPARGILTPTSCDSCS